MNFGMMNVLIDSHTAGIRRQVASRRAAARGRGSRPSTRATGRLGLRNRIGFALVEAGLRLQVTASPLGRRSQAAE